MHRKSLTLATTMTLALGVIFLAACSGGGANPPAQFQAHDIADFSGYAVAVADFNNDGRLDVMANSLGASEVAWYENPTWERHVIIEGVSSVVNQAPRHLKSTHPEKYTTIHATASSISSNGSRSLEIPPSRAAVSHAK